MSAPDRIWVEKSIAEKGNHGSTAWPNTDEPSDIEYTRADLCDPTQDERVRALEAENARLRDALKASREVHCGIADHILERGKFPADGPVDTKGIFADSQRARLGIDAALRALEQG